MSTHICSTVLGHGEAGCEEVTVSSPVTRSPVFWFPVTQTLDIVPTVTSEEPGQGGKVGRWRSQD